MSVRHLRADQVAADIEKQRRLLVGAISQKRLNSKVVGPVMVTGVIMRFLKGRGPNGEQWKSGAGETKLGGRYSKRYKKRPSGRLVSASSIRNNDTGELANSHHILSATATGVKVGPKAALKKGKARKIMEREARYGNHAVGWDNVLKRVLDAEQQAFIDAIANGRTPRYLPKSKIQVRI